MSDERMLSLYPEIREHGSLGKAMLSIAPNLRARLRGFEETGGSIFWADARTDRRAATIVCAAEKRLFMSELHENGVTLAGISTKSLPDVARANEAWIVQSATLTELQESSPFVKLREGAKEYDEGPEQYVSYRWEEMLRRYNETDPGLEPLVSEASKRPELRQLFPFTSHEWLCFSRSIGYPYSPGYPSVQHIGPNSYKVYDAGGKLIGNGNALDAVKLILSALPSDCGPAIKGTAEDL